MRKAPAVPLSPEVPETSQLDWDINVEQMLSGPSSFFLSSNMSALHSSRSSRVSRSIPVETLVGDEGEQVWVDDELQAWRVDYDGVILGKRVSHGAFVEVWKASYRLDVVAVKKLTSVVNNHYRNHSAMIDPIALGKFLAEIKTISRLDHPRIVAFYGVAWRSAGDIMAIMEYMPQQDLQRFLQRRSFENGLSREWSIEKFHIALDVVEAITYLHSLDPVLVHCDIKSRNILLDDKLQAKLSDFGLAKYLEPRNRSTEESKESETMDEFRRLMSFHHTDSVRWIPPEIIRGAAAYSEAVDVYAFGVLLSELDTHVRPYWSGLGSDRAAFTDTIIRQQVAMGNLQPTFSATCPSEVVELARKCLAFDPKVRPSSFELSYQLRKVASKVIQREGRRDHLNSSQYIIRSDTSGDTNESQQSIEVKRYTVM